MFLRALVLISFLSFSPVAIYAAADDSASSKTDDRIHDLVKVKLAGDQLVAGAGIDVSVEGGVVTLKGHVETEQRKSRAERLTKRVKGVKSVNNELKVEPR